jgi:O-antigen ligase
MAVLLLVSFVFAQGAQKIVIVMTAVIAIAASTFLLPGYIQTRFKTFFSSEGSYDAHMEARIDSDIASSEGRKALLIQSIKMTFQHPIFGVGPGCFAFVAWDDRKASTGSGGETLVSHNTYTQVSSETGIPGFILFFSVVFLCVKSVILDYRRLAPIDMEFAQYARYLFSCMAAMAVGIFFLSVGYTHITATIFAFALSLHNIVESVLKTPGSAPAVPVSGWQRPPSSFQRLQPSLSRNRRSTASVSQEPVRSNLRSRHLQVNQRRQPYRRPGPETPQ